MSGREVVEEDDMGIMRANLKVDEKDAPLLIGSCGQNLNAFQAVLKSMMWKQDMEEKSSVQLDINEYRQKYEDRMITTADEKAEAVRATGIVQMMPSMTPYMRRIVHLYLAKKYEDLETESIGEEGRRKIQIKKRGGVKSDAVDDE